MANDTGIFEVISIWEGDFHMQQCLSLSEAREWAEAMAVPGAKVRIWRIA